MIFKREEKQTKAIKMNISEVHNITVVSHVMAYDRANYTRHIHDSANSLAGYLSQVISNKQEQV